MLSPELKAAASFDVEDLLAGPTEDAKATKTDDEGEGQEEETLAETEEEAQAETEEEAGAEEETEEEAQAETEEDTEALKAMKPKMLKRFNKLLEQRDAEKAEARKARAELEALKTQMEQRQDTPTPLQVPSDPLAQVVNEEQLEAYGNHYQRVKAWCRRNPQGGMPPKELTGGMELELDADGVVSNLEDAEKLLERVPEKREFLQKFKAERAKAREAMPEMFKAGTPEQKAAGAYFKRLLSFGAQPDQDLILQKLVKLDTIEREEREGVARYTRVPLKAGKTATGAAAKPAPKPALTARTPNPVLRATNGQTSKEAAWAKMNTPGASVDVEEWLSGE